MGSSQQMIAAYMASGGGGGGTVTRDTDAKSTAGLNVASVTISITIGSNSNRLLLVWCGAGDSVIGDRTVDSVTYTGSGTFNAVSSGSADDGNFMAGSWWYLTAPSTGAQTITVTYAGGATCEQAEAMAISLYDVNQTTPVGATVQVNGSAASTAPTTGNVTLTANQMLVAGIATDSGNQVDIATGVQRQSEINVGGDTAYALATNTGTGSVAITWTTNNETYALVGLRVDPT